MPTKNDPGIDYSLGDGSNVDKETGIHYGIIHQHEVLQAWADSSNPNYGEPTCPKCGNEAVEIHSTCRQLKDGVAVDIDPDEDRDEYEFLHHACGDYACDECKVRFDSEDAFGEEALSYDYDDEGYLCEQDSYGDIFILKSPYYTHAEYCSPCASGAGYIVNACPTGPKTYCFHHDWFDGNKAPYPVYSVATNELVGAE